LRQFLKKVSVIYRRSKVQLTGWFMLARCRKLAAAIGLVAGCIHSGNLFALGLGDLTVNSSLNEPLDATIQMLGLDGLSENQILTAMGGLEDFERAGIDRVGLIDNVILDVEVLDRERGILHITSAEPVVEPFLNMVISVRWPNGRLMRDYTALIDLPVFISDQPQTTPVNVPETPAPARDPAPVPTPAPEPQNFATLEPPAQEEPAVSTVVESAGEDAGAQETIDENIIEDVAEDVAVEEEAVAEEMGEEEAVEEAPEVAEEPAPAAQPDITEPEPVAESVVAFEKSDEEPVSAPDAPEDVTVEAGDTLYGIAAANRPDTSVTVEQTMLAIQRANPEAFTNDNINLIRVGQILRIPAVEDIRSIDQAQAVRQIALQNQASTSQPLVFNTDNTGADQQGTDELTILSGDAGTESLDGDNDLASTIAALENQLAISEENLDRARLENQELRARYAELEEQIEILQNIIAMQDERLAQMQIDLAQRAEAEAQAGSQEQEQAPAPVEPPPAADNSLLGKFSALLENTMVLLGSLVGLILLVVGFLVWRRRAAQQEMEAFEIGGAALADSPEVQATPDEAASLGFLAALKARFTKSDDVDDEVADAIVVEEQPVEDAGGGLLGKLKGLFGRSSSDADADEVAQVPVSEDQDLGDDIENAVDADEEDDLAQDEESLSSDESDHDDEDEEEFAFIDDGFEDDDAEALADDQDDNDDEELIAELGEEDDWETSALDSGSEAVAESLENEADTEELLEETIVDLDDLIGDESAGADDEQAVEADVSLGDFDFEDEEDSADQEATESVAVPNEQSLDADVLDMDEIAGAEESEVASSEATEDDFDFGDFAGLGDNAEESDAEDDTAEAIVVDAEPVSTETGGAEEQVAETAVEADDTETFDFELGDLDTPAEAAAAENVAGDSDGADIESFDFSLDASDDSSTAQTADADLSDDDSADMESFDFDLADTTEAPAEVAEEKAEDDVETFDFDVSSISSFEESAPESGAAEETEADLETFTFDSPEPVEVAADAEVEDEDSDDGDFVIDDIGLHDEPEPAVATPSTPTREEVDPLAAALDEIDAEAEEIGADEISLDDDLDLGSIEIDDSLFESDEDGDEPISDRDESSTKLDLAVAYEAMGDLEGAREILNEVIAEGNGDQVAEAQKLLEKWGQS
jgi:pilus assembly protein FimV